ncbi:hypothetical protein [Clostridium estertheticum]|uniref:hypothetical protein n=1 Tax=Clostridium estertheticum TaxID=238834 RepID=UPI001C0E8CC0|nr:hypothetical protein [Clostridium estertheticum]MBU3217489.1 hypothetical protein [Clostridium estertheticum]
MCCFYPYYEYLVQNCSETAKIDINDPVSCGNIVSVILQPVNLEKVAELVSGDLGELMGYVMKIIS